MSMYDRRLQLLLDQDRFERVSRAARKRKVSVATVIREAIDLAVPAQGFDRRAAAEAILSGPQIALPDPEELKREIADAHDRL
jgi:hypothetical protein